MRFAAGMRRDVEGGLSGSAYTRSPMDTGTVGSTRRVQLDAISVEAQAALDAALERLQDLAEQVRAAYDEAVMDDGAANASRHLSPDAKLLASARALLGRLELAGQQLSRLSESIRPMDDDKGGSAPPHRPIDDAAAAAAALAAQELERSRLAAELHDGPAQALSNIMFQTEILSKTLGTSTPAVEGELAALQQLLERELDGLRAYINELRPPLLEPEGLEDGLRDSAARLEAQTGIAVDIRLEAPGTMLAEPERAVALRVAQEALRNVGKHASATRVWLSTQHAAGDRRWVLEIGDNGQGFDMEDLTAQSSRRHFGLRFMRERAQLLGADLRIDSNPSAGTVVRLSINTGGARS